MVSASPQRYVNPSEKVPIRDTSHFEFLKEKPKQEKVEKSEEYKKVALLAHNMVRFDEKVLKQIDELLRNNLADSLTIQDIKECDDEGFFENIPYDELVAYAAIKFTETLSKGITKNPSMSKKTDTLLQKKTPQAISEMKSYKDVSIGVENIVAYSILPKESRDADGKTGLTENDGKAI